MRIARTTRIGLLALAAVLRGFTTAPAAAPAAPAAVSEPHLTGSMPVIPDPACGVDGARLSLQAHWLPGPGELCDMFLQRVSPDGSTEIAATLATSVPCGPAVLVCGNDGRGVALVSESWGAAEWTAWDVDASGQVVGSPWNLTTIPYCAPDFWILKDDGELLSLDTCPDADSNPRLALRRFARSPDVEAGPLWLTEPAADWIINASAAVDSAGNVFVAWMEGFNHDEHGQYDFRLVGRAVLADGGAAGAELRIDTFDPPSAWLSRIHAESEGVFSLYWTSIPEGGTVTRTISIDPDVFTFSTTTTTTLPPSPDAPDFDVVRTVGHSPAGSPDAPVFDTSLLSLRGDGNGTLLLRRGRAATDQQEFNYDEPISDSSLYLSPDAGVRWGVGEDPAISTRLRDGPSCDGASPNGTVLTTQLIWEHVDSNEWSGLEGHLVSKRSTDHGRTWADRAIVGVIYGSDEFWYFETALASDGKGNWIAASMTSNDYHSRIDMRWSFDDGRTWTGGQQIELGTASDECCTDESDVRYSVAAAAGADGSWQLAWRSEKNGSVKTARAAAAESPWEITEITSPSGLPPGADPGEWYDHLSPYGRAALATTASGVRIVAWEEKRPSAALGSDSEIYFSRSADHGVTWSEPAPIGTYASIDGAADSDPSLAVDGEGRILAVWSSNDSLGATIGTDADIVSSISVDGGVTWSPPAAVDPSAADDERRDLSPLAVGDSAGRWTVAWTTMPIRNRWYWDLGKAEVKVAVAGAACGNGAVDAGEDCDDANRIDGDGCNANCTLAGCGNELVEAGEACDDISLIGPSCTADCELSLCGDGERDIWSEQCDDANGDDSDECPGNCLRARCGDGFTFLPWEECDDANSEDNDGCRNGCRRAFCGDGLVRDGVELCDDGDWWAGNACTDECRPAVCGDGRTWIGVEECDDPDGSLYGGACTPDCKRSGVCSDADANGIATATDALTILRFAVGLGDSCSPDRCDLDGNGGVFANDALMALKYSAGLGVQLKCPTSNGAIFVLDDQRTFGSLMFQVDASELGIEFAISGPDPQCELLAKDAMSVGNVPGEGKLTLAFISLKGLHGPTPLARCRVFLRHDAPVDGSLQIKVVESVDSNGNPLEPPPRIQLVMD